MGGYSARRDGATSGVEGLGRAPGGVVLQSDSAPVARKEPIVMAKPRWILVVQENQRELYELLQQRLQGTALVVVDRRRGERLDSSGVVVEGRRADRRRPRPLASLYAAAVSPASERTGPMQATPGTVSKGCTDCSDVLEFEIPRFPQPPARLETDVIHIQQAGRGVEHYVEVQAFTGSGRQLVGQRIHTRQVKRS